MLVGCGNPTETPSGFSLDVVSNTRRNGIERLDGFKTFTKKRFAVKTMGLPQPLFVICGFLDMFERVVADESFPLGGWKWRGTPGKNVVHLLNDVVDMGVNVNLPRWQWETLKFSSNFPLDTWIAEGTLGKEDLGAGSLLFVAGEESNVNGGKDVVVFGINLLDTFGFPSFAAWRLDSGKVEVVVGVGHEDRVLETMVDKHIVDPPLGTIGMLPSPRFVGLPLLKGAGSNEFVR